MGQIADAIKEKLTNTFNPSHLEIIDESAKHAGHAGIAGREGGESHFQVVIVSPKFKNMSRLARHRAVMDALGDLMKEKVHALRLEARAE